MNAMTQCTNPVKIVVLDGRCLNPGDLNWSEFEALGPTTVYKSSPPNTVVERSRDAFAIITNKTLVDAKIMDALPQLRYIGILATGYNVVEIAAARERDIIVTNVPKYSTDSVAQCAFTHILNLSFHFVRHNDAVKAGKWCSHEDFCFWETSLLEISGKTLGIVGYGEIGKAVAKIASAFGMKVLAYGPRLAKDGSKDDNGVSRVDLPTLLKQSDVVSLHCPLTAENKEMVNGEFLSQMKRTAFLINTSRGGLVNEKELAEALNNGRIAGAGVDVLACEPPKPDNPLLTAENCYISPHIAWATFDSRRRLMEIAAANLRAFLAGDAKNVV